MHFLRKKLCNLTMPSSFSTCPNNKFEAKQSIDGHDWNKLMNHCAPNDFKDYENAVRLQVDTTAATQNDAVGRVMSKLDKAIGEERHEDAMFLQGNTSADCNFWKIFDLVLSIDGK